jgi:hypothetical protein
MGVIDAHSTSHASRAVQVFHPTPSPWQRKDAAGAGGPLQRQNGVIRSVTYLFGKYDIHLEPLVAYLNI